MTDMTKESSNYCSKNVELLRILMKNSAEEIASNISPEEFKTIIASLNHKPSIANKLYDLQRNHIKSTIDQDVDYMFEESGINEKYNEISNLVNQSSPHKKGWISAVGDCEVQMRPHLKQALNEKKQKLEELIQKKNTEITKMKKILNNKRKLIYDQHEHLTRAKSKVRHYDDVISSTLILNS